MLNLTKQEKIIILFLLGSLIAGCAVVYYKDAIVSYFGPEKKQEARVFDAKQPAMININTATQKELESLPHIGPAMAKRIIEYRGNNGLFLLKEDLMKVKGIGKKAYEALENRITTQ